MECLTQVGVLNGGTVVNVAAIAESVTVSQSLFTTRQLQELGTSLASLNRIFRKDLGLHAYKL